MATASAVIAQITPEETETNSTDAELSGEVVTEPEKSEPSGESVPITAAVTPKQTSYLQRSHFLTLKKMILRRHQGAGSDRKATDTDRKQFRKYRKQKKK